MLGILRLEALKNFTFLKLSGIHLHELFHSIKLILHGYTLIHDIFLSLTNILQLIELIFDSCNSWVLINLACIS